MEDGNDVARGLGSLLQEQLKTSKELNTSEFKDYCEQIRVWSMSEFNFTLEEPETNK